MKRKLAGLVVTLVVCVFVSQAGAATEVDHFTDGPFSDEVCGVSGTTVVHGTALVQERRDGSVVFSGTFWSVFTADNGKSITVSGKGPVVVSAPVIDEEAGTATIYSTFRGLPEKLSVTNGRTVDVFEYTGDPEEPLGDQIDSFLEDLHGPHPDLLSDFEAFCDVLGPYLQDP
jgi:hypothetical protein